MIVHNYMITKCFTQMYVKSISCLEVYNKCTAETSSGCTFRFADHRWSAHLVYDYSPEKICNHECMEDSTCMMTVCVFVCVWTQVKPSAPQLFSGSGDEEDGDEEDASRFDIRPQFEGRAGQKVRR